MSCALRAARGDASGDVACACGLSLARTERGFFTAHSDGPGADYPEDGNEVFFELEEKSFWFRHRNRVLLALLERFAPGGPVWDIGGGNGFQALAFERAGVDCVLVEPGPRGCANASRRGVHVVIQARLEDLELPDAHLAAASFLDVLEHLDDPAPLLRETARALVPGGRVYVTVPAYEALWSEADDYAEHKRRYTSASLERDLSRGGLELEHLTHYFQPLVLPIALLRALPSRLRKLRGASAPRTGEEEHSDGGLAERAIVALLERELAAIAAGRRLRVGASIVAVARKA